MDSSQLWRSVRSGDTLARERLVEKHLPLVRFVARKLYRSLPEHVELTDLVSAGTVGLMEAIDGFDEQRGLKFSTYAVTRIRGAILDDLRRLDPAPRALRRNLREIARVTDTLASELEREPDSTETATALGVDRDTLFRWQVAAAESVSVPLDAPMDPTRGRSATPAEVLIGSRAEQIEDGVNHKEEVAALMEAIQGLGERDRLVLTLYYFEGLKLAEIAQVFDLTEARVSQLRSKALRILRGRLGHLRGEVA